MNEWSGRLGWRTSDLYWPILEFIKRLVSVVGWFEGGQRLIDRVRNRNLMLSNPSERDSIVTALQVLSGVKRDLRNKTTVRMVKKLAPGLFVKE